MFLMTNVNQFHEKTLEFNQTRPFYSFAINIHFKLVKCQKMSGLIKIELQYSVFIIAKRIYTTKNA